MKVVGRPGDSAEATHQPVSGASPKQKGTDQMIPETDAGQGAPAPSLNGEGPSGDRPFDPFDPEALRVSGIADVDIEQVLTTVPVRNPKRREFFRVNPDPNYTLDTYLLERDAAMDKERYLVVGGLRQTLMQELRQVRLFTAINKSGTVFLWPAKLAGDGNAHLRRISDSALLAAEEAKTQWVRVWWNRDLGAYEMARAKGDLGSPQWPDKSFRDLLEIGFRHNLIDRADHPVIRQLSGEL